MTTFTYSTYKTLTNLVLAELNEVQLTDANFSSAVGFQSVAKSAVQRAIRIIQNQDWEWPFNHVYTTKVCTPGVQFYNLPNDCKTVDWDTFFLLNDQTLPSPVSADYLPQISYDVWTQKFRAIDLNMDPSSYQRPLGVIRSQATQFGITPPPDQAYTIQYEYWQDNVAMELSTDQASVPDRFNYVIVDGAMHYCYRFRENLDAASEAWSRFMDGIKLMRNVYIINYIAVTDNRAGPQFRTIP